MVSKLFASTCLLFLTLILILSMALPQLIPSTQVVSGSAKDDFFENLFKTHPGKFDSILKNNKEWNVQIIYTQIDRGKNGIPQFKNYYFNHTETPYFYPASAVKLPIALLALQKINELKTKGIDRNTTMITEANYSRQTPVYNDPTSPDGKPNIAQYIKKIFLVSNNDAFNRLYEFLGQEYINSELSKKGYGEAQILHRLEEELTEDENRHTNPIKFYNNRNEIIYSKAVQYNFLKFPSRNNLVGKAYYQKDILKSEPMDFSKKNSISLQSLHNILVSLVFPEKIHDTQHFNITNDDRNFILKYMSAYPRESSFPSYDTAYHDSFTKFIFFGSQKDSLQNNIRIFNKSGQAYGQLTDVAYVVDFKNKIEFFVSATIYCNSDGILNDDKYDYDTIGFPFMKNIGQALYDHELKRKKDIEPDLSSLIFDYH